MTFNGDVVSGEVGQRRPFTFRTHNPTVLDERINTMKTTNLLVIAIVSGSLAISGVMFAKEKHEEENISSSDVPAAVQKAAEDQAKGGKIVRWEKEGANYEAVIEKGGKEWGFTFDANGKMLGKHSEAAEKGEKHKH